MYNRLFKWLTLISAFIISIMTIGYCLLMNYKRSIFMTLVTEITVNNENLYFQLQSITRIIETSIYIIFSLFFITICIIYVLKNKKYLVALLSIFIMSFISFIVTLPFVIKVGYINYLMLPIYNFSSGIGIFLISLLVRYFYNISKKQTQFFEKK